MGDAGAAGTVFRCGNQRIRHSMITGSRACGSTCRSITIAAELGYHAYTGYVGPTTRTTEPCPEGRSDTAFEYMCPVVFGVTSET
jgi:hypothetical protein